MLRILLDIFDDKAWYQIEIEDSYLFPPTTSGDIKDFETLRVLSIEEIAQMGMTTI